MSRISIIMLNRDSRDAMEDSLAAVPATPDSEILYLTPGGGSEVTCARLPSGVQRIEYPGTAPANRDIIWAAERAAGDLLIYTDTLSLFRSWEINNISQMLFDTTDVVLTLHRPNGREADNVADLAALALNAMLRHADLSAASPLRFPYGLRRGVLDRVDVATMRWPAIFLTACVLEGLKVDTSYRAEEPSAVGPVAPLLVESHIAAMYELLRRRGPRGGFTDFDRRRTEWKPTVRSLVEP